MTSPNWSASEAYGGSREYINPEDLIEKPFVAFLVQYVPDAGPTKYTRQGGKTDAVVVDVVVLDPENPAASKLYRSQMWRSWGAIKMLKDAKRGEPLLFKWVEDPAIGRSSRTMIPAGKLPGVADVANAWWESVERKHDTSPEREYIASPAQPPQLPQQSAWGQPPAQQWGQPQPQPQQQQWGQPQPQAQAWGQPQPQQQWGAPTQPQQPQQPQQQWGQQPQQQPPAPAWGQQPQQQPQQQQSAWGQPSQQGGWGAPQGSQPPAQPGMIGQIPMPDANGGEPIPF